VIIQTMVQPSFWIDSGIQIQQVLGLNLFKLTDDLQARLETRLEKHKAQTITATATAEFAGITELDRIFTLVNARIIAASAPPPIWEQLTTIAAQAPDAEWQKLPTDPPTGSDAKL
jgi:hypothetical protein